MILVDTSVWIEFFRPHPSKLNSLLLENLIEEGEVVTCFPIWAEVLSGKMTLKTRQTVSDAFKSMIFIDVDLNSPQTWEELIELAHFAKKYKLGIPGLIDRIILLASKKSTSQLWSLDKKLNHLAKALSVDLLSLH